MIDELASRIWGNQQFHADASSIFRAYLQDDLGLDREKSIDYTQLDRLLQSVVCLSSSRDPSMRSTAYKVATTAYQLYGDELEGVAQVASLVLARLGNFPGIDYLGRVRGTPSIAERMASNEVMEPSLPLPLTFETDSHLMANRIPVNGSSLVFTDFQIEIWKGLVEGKAISVSAPTSAGKSFVLKQFLSASVRSDAILNAAYLVPTRALINQVSDDLRSTFQSIETSNVSISTLPIRPEESARSTIHVLTQERMQLLLDEQKDIRFDFLIVDEAHSISEPARGVILQAVIDQLLELNPSLQIAFVAPNVANPEIFSRSFGLGSLTVAHTEDHAVSQNLIFVDVASDNPNRARLEFLSGGARQPLGTLNLNHGLYEPNQKLAFFAHRFGHDTQSLVYASGQSNCEKLAFMIADLNGSSDDIAPEVRALSEFAKEHIHSKYALASTVLGGVAFHYGNMPTLLRKSIERTFEAGGLSHLVCTSTLLHGVNLPAKRIFLNRPTTGKNNPISVEDFWNLVGRAGRLGKEFGGDVFLLDHSRWESEPLLESKERKVSPSLEFQVTENSSSLVKFIDSPDTPSGSDEALENAFVKLFSDYRKDRLERTLDRMGSALDDTSKKQLVAALENAAERISLPSDVTDRSLNVSVYRQEALYQYFRKRIADKGPKGLLPKHPLTDFSEANDSLRWVFKRIHTHLEGRHGKDKSHFYYAPLALRWMRGDPLPQLIDDAYEYRLKKQSKPNIGTVIRSVMTDIETHLRFRYVKFMTCYANVLTEAYRSMEFDSYVERIPPISLFLEIGASSQLMISLRSLGLSRVSAKLLSDRAVKKDMDVDAAKRWISSLEVAAMDFGVVCEREILDVQESITKP